MTPLQELPPPPTSDACPVCDGNGYVDTGRTFGLVCCSHCHGTGMDPDTLWDDGGQPR